MVTVRSAVVPEAFQAGAGEHAAHRAVAGLGNQATTRPANVRKVGLVKHDRNTANRSASDAGTVSSGSIDGSLSRGWYRNRRCFPHDIPRSTTTDSRRVVS
jgi:hypothetical protein